MYQIDLINTLMAVIAGGFWSFLFRNWEINRRTVILSATFFIPLTIGRIIYVIAGGEVQSSGWVGTFYFIVYFISAALTRWIIRGNISEGR